MQSRPSRYQNRYKRRGQSGEEQAPEAQPEKPKSPEELRKRAQEIALWRLGRSEVSAVEMVRYLKKRGVEEPLAKEVVNDFVARDYISDDRYAKMVTRSQLGRGKGPGYVRQKLSQKGVKLDRTQIKDLVEEVPGFDEIEAAQRVAESRYPGLANDPKEANRAFQALVRRGFSFDVARTVIARIKKGEA